MICLSNHTMSLEVKTPFFSFLRKVQTEILLQPGQSILILEWSWRQFGYKRKVVMISEDGDIRVTYV